MSSSFFLFGRWWKKRRSKEQKLGHKKAGHKGRYCTSRVTNVLYTCTSSHHRIEELQNEIPLISFKSPKEEEEGDIKSSSFSAAEMKVSSRSLTHFNEPKPRRSTFDFFFAWDAFTPQQANKARGRFFAAITKKSHSVRLLLASGKEGGKRKWGKNIC